MADINYFAKPTPVSLAQLSVRIGASLSNPNDSDFFIDGVAGLDVAQSNHLAFLDNKKYRNQFSSTKAGAVIIHPDMVSIAPDGARLLLSETPYKSYAMAAQLLYPEKRPDIGISDISRIHASVKIGTGASIGDFVCIAENVEIGDNVWIDPYVSIESGVRIGNNCRFGSHSSISHSIIGDNVRLYPGVRIGQDGFGFAIDPTGFVKVPQLGRVVMGNNIEVGANTCIDRGSSGDTMIGTGTWIDNLVHISHNVIIGRSCVIVAQSGIAGSTELGDFVVLGGQVGVSGHLKIGSMARVAAKSGVTKNIPSKEEWMGYPAMPMKQFLRQVIKAKHLTEK